MNRKEFDSLKDRATVYLLIQGNCRVRDDKLSDCTESGCLNWRTKYDGCGKYNCHICKGYGKYKKLYHIPYCNIETVKILDTKRSGYIKTHYDPGFDGGWGGDYYEASETWKHYSEVYLTKEEALAARPKHLIYTSDQVFNLFEKNREKLFKTMEIKV